MQAERVRLARLSSADAIRHRRGHTGLRANVRTAIGFVIFEMITDRQGLAQNHLLVRTAGLEPAQSSDP
jgi:hypothetical protein